MSSQKDYEDFLLEERSKIDEELREPRVDKITATYFRKGKCAVCSGSVERTRSFVDTTLTGCQSQAAAWEQAPLKHKRCE